MAAIIKLKDKSRIFVPYRVGIRFWLLKSGEARNPSPDELVKLDSIADIYLDRRKAPESYLKAHSELIESLHANEDYSPPETVSVQDEYERRYG